MAAFSQKARIEAFLWESHNKQSAKAPNSPKPWGYYLETDPDRIAMVITVKLFIHKPCKHKTSVT